MNTKLIAWRLLIIGFFYGAFERTGAAFSDGRLDIGEVSQLGLVLIYILSVILLNPSRKLK